MKPFAKKIYRMALSMLGFASCSIPAPWDEPVDMYAPPVAEYGVPTVSYIIRGTVTNKEGNPLSGIKVKTLWEGINGERVSHTDSNGQVEVKTSLYSWDADGDIRIAFEDEDGPENGGAYARDTLFKKDLKIEKTSNGDGHWLMGEYKIEFKKELSPEK